MRLSESHTSQSFIGSSFYGYKQKNTNTKPYKFLCNMKVLYSMQNLVIELSVSWKNVTKCSWIAIYGHWIISVMEGVWQKFSWIVIYGCWIISHREHATKFFWIAIYNYWIVSVAESMQQCFPVCPYMVIGLLVLWKLVTKFYWIIMVVWWQIMVNIMEMLLLKFSDFWQVAKLPSCKETCIMWDR